MNGILIESNVYYLPTLVEPDPVELAAQPEWPSFAVRVRNAWWRLRLAVAEVRGILRRPRRRAFGDDVVLLDEATDPAPRQRLRPAGPARIIDFDAARLRLRPAARA
jgi:hypothetical protein